MTGRGFLVVALALGLVGCDRARKDEERKRDQAALHSLYLAYINYEGVYNRPPASAEELAGYAADRWGMDARTLSRFQVVWGVKLELKPEPNVARRCLASSPAVDGIVSVLLLDGNTKAVPETEAAKLEWAKSEPVKIEPVKKP